MRVFWECIAVATAFSIGVCLGFQLAPDISAVALGICVGAIVTAPVVLLAGRVI
jgi:hypothetical protein